MPAPTHDNEPLTPPPEEEVFLEKGYLDQEASVDRTPELDHRVSLFRRAQHATGSLAIVLSATLAVVVPSFLRRGLAKPAKLRKTAYLDGLRGFAALLVYILHHGIEAHQNLVLNHIENAFGHDGHYYFCALPFVRIFFSGGHMAVATFFVISGYVLSAKAISLIQARDLVALGDSLGSSLFRRWLRLWLPIVPVSFIIMSLYHVTGILPAIQPQKNWTSELAFWWHRTTKFSFLWDGSGDIFYQYNSHLWSIPVEMRGSITIFTTLMATSRCTRNARLLVNVALIYYFLYWVDGAHYAMFLAGMLLVDLDGLAASDNLPRFFRHFEKYKSQIWGFMFVAAMYLGGVPAANNDMDDFRATPGWYYLSFLKPKPLYNYKSYYLFWAAVFMVVTAPRIGWLKKFFESGFCQYLGRISFSFYMVHGPVLYTLGRRLYAAVGWNSFDHALVAPGWTGRFPITKFGPYDLEVSFLLTHVILLPVTLWVAEMVMVLFDDPSIKLASWLYKKATMPSGPGGAQSHQPGSGIPR